MVQALRMPMMGNTMETGLLAEWHVDEGDPVEADEVVAVVESEKAAADVVANRDGTLARVDVGEGEEVPPGTVIGVVLGPDEGLADAPPPRSRVEPGGTDGHGGDEGGTAPETDPAPGAGGDPATASLSDDDRSGGPEGAVRRVRAAPGARRLADETGVDLGEVEGSGPDGAVLIADVEEHLGGRTFVAPSARRLARELGVAPAEIEGTGVEGRVTESDVRRAAGLLDIPAGGTDHSGPVASDVPASDGITGPPPRDASRLGVTVAEERELSGVRRTVAERMSRSAGEAPQVTLDRTVAVERAFETAEGLAEEGDADVGFTDLLVGSAVRALERHPEFNAWYEGEVHRLIEQVNVAVAVDAEAGLLTPVVRDAGDRSLDGIARERRRLTDAVLEGRHRMDDLQGGTFTVSNLGPFGVDSFDPILDPPQVAILGVGRVSDGRCTLSLTFDHRVVDGADAARFLDTLARGVESPAAVVAERAAAGADASAAGASGGTGPGSDPGREASSEPAHRSGRGDVESAVAGDVAERAREVAAAHDWPVPEFEVRLGDGPPTVVVRWDGETSPATLRRLAYAACRESRYADTVAGLRDPEIDLRSGGSGSGDERD
jgi:pyruvate dehydrogenase E2 component (dihydrolipoamide acetyltransferase)